MSDSVSLYIPTLNSAAHLPDVLSALAPCRSLAQEILVVDGGSSDHTVRIARQYGARIVPNPRRHVAAARRLAVEQASGDILVSIDSDCIPVGDWLSALVRHFTADSELTGVGGPYVCSAPRNDVQRFASQVFENIMSFPTCLTLVDQIQMSGTFVEGNCGFRRSDLLAIGNYQECFTNHAEGVDLFWRLLRAGKKLLFDPALKVEHVGYPWTIGHLVRRNYHYGWSSTKLAKYTLRRTSVDRVLWGRLLRTVPAAIQANPRRRREALLSLAQLTAFIGGKIVSSARLKHLNL